MHSISVLLIVISFLFDVFVGYNIYYIYIYIFFFLFGGGGLPLYGVYDSSVDYPNDDVVYYH